MFKPIVLTILLTPITSLATEVPGLDLKLKSLGATYSHNINDPMMGNMMSLYGKFQLKEGVRGRLSWRRRNSENPFYGQAKNSIMFGLEFDID